MAKKKANIKHQPIFTDAQGGTERLLCHCKQHLIITDHITITSNETVLPSTPVASTPPNGVTNTS
jgi:hypothetical protein